MIFRCVVVGLPSPKGSLTPIVIAGGERAINIEKKSSAARAKLAEWTRACVKSINAAMAPILPSGGYPLFGYAEKPKSYLLPVIVRELRFILPRPKSRPEFNRKGEPTGFEPTTYPDVDKLARVVLDCMSKRVYIDDRQIVSVHPTKEYEREPHGMQTKPLLPGVEILVMEWHR